MVNAVSTLNLDPLNPRYIAVEQFAFKGWVEALDHIEYLNLPDPRFEHPKVSFGTETGIPTIKQLVEKASALNGITLLINADVWVPPHTATVLQALVNSGKVCGFSNRWNYDPETMDVGAAQFHPGGLDIFFGTREVWVDVASRIPAVFRFGSAIWDAWMMNYFQGRFREKFINFTAQKLMAHPLFKDTTPMHSSAKMAEKRAFEPEIGRWYNDNKDTDPVMVWRPGKSL